MKLTQKEKLLRAAKYEQGYLYCPNCKVFKPKNQFSHLAAKKFPLSSNNPYCKECRRVKLRNLHANGQSAMRDLLGGDCQVCGYSGCAGVLVFYCVPPNVKTIYLGEIRSVTKKVKQELNKCCLLCRNCRNEKDAGLWSANFVRAYDKLGYYIKTGSLQYEVNQ